MPCIGLFFMVSGALLLPTEDNGIDFMKKRLSKVLIPLLVWTVVGIVMGGLSNGFGSSLHLIQKICSIPFSTQGHGVLWFMYVLIGLYLITPIISPWLERCSRKELKMYLLLWLVTMTFPYLKMVLTVNDSITGSFYYLSGYVGYFLLGYYLRKYGCGKTLVALLWLPVPYILLGISKKLGLCYNLEMHFSYLCLPTAITTWSLFTIIRNAESRLAALGPMVLQIITHFSNCSFGIYLMHIFIMRVGLWHLFDKYHVGGGISLFVSFFGTLAISYTLTTIVSYLPFGDYIIGYKKKRK